MRKSSLRNKNFIYDTHKVAADIVTGHVEKRFPFPQFMAEDTDSEVLLWVR
jgi:hypothetical protein